ncbi:MAG TPA: carboxypeptidase-like regulatory domain-containing protein, partial [Pyrinomonadaceae bacterium]
MREKNGSLLYRLPCLFLTLLSGFAFLSTRAAAQDTVTGAFDGVVIDKLSGAPVKGATVQLISQEGGRLPTLTTDPRGQFFQALLRPGTYTLRVVKAGYQDLEVTQELPTLRRTEFESTPDGLEPAAAGRRAPAKPSPRPGHARLVVIAMTPK